MLGTTRVFSFFAILGFFLFVYVNSVVAVSAPTFSSCVNPSGTIIAQYLSGTHGIPGVTDTKTGSDIVYRLTQDTVMQCFCPADGAGIQTNWWKVQNLTQSEINGFLADGWIFVPDGSLWGLDASPYIVKNLNYLCIGGQGGGEVTSSSSSSSSSSTGVGGAGGGVIGQVLGLASTGNLVSIVGLLAIGLFLIVLSFKKNAKSN